VPGATVTLLDVQTGLSRKTMTNTAGLYTFPLVAPGEYKLTVAKTGFSTEVNPPFRLDVNQNVTQDFTLRVGEATETVTVSTNSELIDATSATLGTVVESRPVSDLPLNGRNFTALLTLAPGVNPVNYSQNGGVGYGTNQNAVGIPSATFVYPAVQGQWNRENIYFLDGVINTGGLSSTYDIPPIVDAIQEFKIQSHNDDAQFGGVLGGVVNIVTKSGTNRFHGTGWEYARNNIFDARNPFTDFTDGLPSSPATFHQNEFGGSFGGPVWLPKLYNGRNKTFFFAAYEGWRYTKAAGASYISPNPAELDGDFTNAAVGQYLLYNPFTTTGTPGNYTRQLLGEDGLHIPQELIDTTAQAFLKAFSDTPNFTPTTVGGNNTILNTVGTDNANELNFRIDQNFGPNNRIWARYSSLDGANTSPISQHLQAVSASNNRNFGGGYTHVFRANLILDATVGYSGRFNAVAKNQPVNVSAAGLALYSALQANFGLVNFAFTQGYTGIGGLGPIGSESHELNFSVNTTWIKGKHQIRFGFEEQIPQLNQGTSGGKFGIDQFSFAQAETENPQAQGSTGNALASALLGVPDNGRYQTEVNGSRVVAPAAYVQDTWNATPKLTINAGLRWDGESSPHLLFNTVASMFDPNTGNWLISGGKLPPPCNPAQGVYAPCIPVADPATNAILAAHVVVDPNPNLGPDPVYTDFGPRFGFAYRVQPSIVVSGGYGLIYDNITGGIQSVRDRLFSWPYNSSFSPVYNVVGQPTQTLSTIIPGLSNTNALPATTTPFTGIGWSYDPHLKNHYSHQFNLEVQKEITSTLVASIAYVGSIDRHLPVTGKDNNSPEPGGAGLDRPFPWAQTQLESTSRGSSNYNALQARLDKRFSKGLSFGTGFTWSKGLDNAAGGLYDVEAGPQGFAEFQNYNDINANYGISANSLKFIYYGWGIYELPFGKGKQFLTGGVASAILGGWQVNVNLSAHSGAPLGFVDSGFDPANIGDTIGFFSSIRPNVSGSPKLPHPNKNEAFNTAVFSHPVNEYGNSGRGLLTATPYENVDFSLMKGFKIKDKVDIQIRPEFFNVFNIQNYGLPGVTFGGGNFGVVSGLAAGATPRQIQLSIRGSF
jgi:hypothetical protein